MKTDNLGHRPEPARPTLHIVRDLHAPSDALHQITGGKATPRLLETAAKGTTFKEVVIHTT